MTPSDAHPTQPPDLAALRAENAQLRRELGAFHRTNVELTSFVASLLADLPEDDLEEAIAAELVPDDEPGEAPELSEPAAAASSEGSPSQEAAEADPVDPFEDFTTALLLGVFRHLGELRLAGHTPHGVVLGFSSGAPGSSAQMSFMMQINERAPLTRGGLLDDLFRAVLQLRADHPDVFEASAGSPAVLSPDHPAYAKFLELVKEHNIALPPLPSPSPEEAP